MSENKEGSMDEARELLLSTKEGDRAVGVNMVKVCAKNGDPLAHYAIASWIINEAHGWKFSQKKAECHLKIAMSGGVADAFYEYGVLCLESGGRFSKREAFSCFVASAMLGDEDSKQEVADSIMRGRGCFKSEMIGRMLVDCLKRSNK